MDKQIIHAYLKLIKESNQIGKVNHNNPDTQIRSFKELCRALRKEFKTRLGEDSTEIEICGAEIVHISWDWYEGEGILKSLQLTLDFASGEITYTDQNEETGILNDFEPLNVQKTVDWVIKEFIKAPVIPSIKYVAEDDDLQLIQ